MFKSCSSIVLNSIKCSNARSSQIFSRLASNAAPAPTRIGFVGVGNMGSLMSAHLINKGHEVLIYDVNKSAVNDLVSKGAKSANSLADIGEQCERVFTMLPNPQIILDVYKRPDGLLSRAKPTTVFADSSTIDPSTAQDVHKAAKQKGIKFFDAPVAGAVPAARAASLVFMVGGDKADIQQYLEPYLLQMGTSVFVCGDVGSGCVAKICNNMMLAISMLGLSEALLLGKNNGLDPKIASAIINKGSGRCWSSEIYNPVPGIIETAPSTNDYNGGFKVSLLYKDLGLASKVATEVTSPTPLGTLTHQFYRLLMQSVELQEKDFSVIYQYLDKQPK